MFTKDCTFLLTDRIKSAAVNVGGGGVLVCCWVVDCPPWGEGSCEVEAISPTATQVEHDLYKEFTIETAILSKRYLWKNSG